MRDRTASRGRSGPVGPPVARATICAARRLLVQAGLPVQSPARASGSSRRGARPPTRGAPAPPLPARPPRPLAALSPKSTTTASTDPALGRLSLVRAPSPLTVTPEIDISAKKPPRVLLRFPDVQGRGTAPRPLHEVSRTYPPRLRPRAANRHRPPLFSAPEIDRPPRQMPSQIDPSHGPST